MLIKHLLFVSGLPLFQAPACAVDARIRETQQFDPVRQVHARVSLLALNKTLINR
jgi:hypothetical protein